MMINLQLLRYALSGLILNCLGFVSFAALLKLNFSPIIAATIQYPLIFFIYYLTQTYLVFNKNISKKNFAQFLLNALFIYLLNIGSLLICIEILNLNALLSQFLIMIILILVNFFIQKKIIFNINKHE